MSPAWTASSATGRIRSFGAASICSAALACSASMLPSASCSPCSACSSTAAARARRPAPSSPWHGRAPSSNTAWRSAPRSRSGSLSTSSSSVSTSITANTRSPAPSPVCSSPACSATSPRKCCCTRASASGAQAASARWCSPPCWCASASPCRSTSPATRAIRPMRRRWSSSPFISPRTATTSPASSTSRRALSAPSPRTAR